MSELETKNINKRRSRGGSGARRAIRGKQQIIQFPYISRKVPIYDVLSLEGLEIIEHNADTILEEIGVGYNRIPIDLFSQTPKSEEYRQIHPLGAVPFVNC